MNKYFLYFVFGLFFIGCGILAWVYYSSQKAKSTDVNGAANANVQITKKEKLKIYLVAIDDKGQSGKLIGCDDSLVPIEFEVASNQNNAKYAFNKLLNFDPKTNGYSNLYNVLYQSSLNLEGIVTEEGKVFVRLSGSLRLGGVCDNPRIVEQIKETIKGFYPNEELNILLNGEKIEDALSLK